jgi:hypothetical protein
VKRVRAKAEENGLKFPIAVDKGGQNWKNWENRYWPSVYLIDKKGRVQYRWEGELDSETTKGERLMRQRVDGLLAEKGKRHLFRYKLAREESIPGTWNSAPRKSISNGGRHEGHGDLAISGQDDLDCYAVRLPDPDGSDKTIPNAGTTSMRRSDPTIYPPGYPR